MKQIKKTFALIKKFFYFLFIKQRRFRQRIFFGQKIKKIIKKNPVLSSAQKIDNEYKKKSQHFLQSIHRGYKNTNWHFAYSTLNGIKDERYIPEELFFPFIEPALNFKPLKNAYTDKNSSELFIDKNHLPQTIFKIINGRFYRPNNERVDKNEAIKELEKSDEKLVFKPAIYSGGGKNVVVTHSGELVKMLNKNNRLRKDGYVIQKFAQQHPVFERFNSSSFNTLRIMTARVKNEIVVISVYFRMGKKGNTIDNIVTGGVLCGVGENGKLYKTGYDIRFNAYEKHPDSEIIFDGFKLPGYKNAVEFCKKHHWKFPHFTFISWDIGISPLEQAIFIEMNLSSQEIGCHQIINGPLFGKYTNYFIEEYKNSMLPDQIQISF